LTYAPWEWPDRPDIRQIGRDLLGSPGAKDTLRVDFRGHEFLALLASNVNRLFRRNHGGGMLEAAQRLAGARILNIRKMNNEAWFYSFS
jgi:hypothetical protein